MSTFPKEENDTTIFIAVKKNSLVFINSSNQSLKMRKVQSWTRVVSGIELPTLHPFSIRSADVAWNDEINNYSVLLAMA